MTYILLFVKHYSTRTNNEDRLLWVISAFRNFINSKIT